MLGVIASSCFQAETPFKVRILAPRANENRGSGIHVAKLRELQHNGGDAEFSSLSNFLFNKWWQGFERHSSGDPREIAMVVAPGIISEWVEGSSPVWSLAGDLGNACGGQLWGRPSRVPRNKSPCVPTGGLSELEIRAKETEVCSSHQPRQLIDLQS